MHSEFSDVEGWLYAVVNTTKTVTATTIKFLSYVLSQSVRKFWLGLIVA
jgi:hypothetical protein